MSTTSFLTSEQLQKLRLIRSNNVGPVSFFRLLRKYGTAQKALAEIPQAAEKSGNRGISLASIDTIKREVERVDTLGARYLFHDDVDYPPILTQLHNAPPVLILRGNVSLLQKPAIAIVGARNASAASRHFAKILAKDLSEKGVVVVSGLAKGIDTAAHEGSIDHATVAVIAGGTDIHFPPENAALQEAIADRGLVLSEQPPGTEPHARHFPFRNRIISGLASGTVIVEAAPNSGSLITARLAAETGRQVMAVPGSPMDPRSQGCNDLIREGASLIQSADDVLELINPIDDRMEKAKSATVKEFNRVIVNPESGNPVAMDQDEKRKRILELLSPIPVTVDELVRQSRVGPADIQLILLELELAGKLTRSAGARVALASFH